MVKNLKIVLTGDAGATKTELALFKITKNKSSVIHSARYNSNDYRSLEFITEDFLKDIKTGIDAACIGGPGPLLNGKIISTNLPWMLDEKKLSGKLQIKNFKLLNDLEALAYSLELLKEKDLIIIYKGIRSRVKKNIAVIAPGTGLGQAAIVYNIKESKYIVVPTEGGHTDFAPDSDIEYGLYKHLKNKFGHVSYERIVSGMGIINIYEYLLSTGQFESENNLEDRFRSEDMATVISGEAIKGKNKLCKAVMNIFVSVLGRQAGNMVLDYKATGGVYLGGSIPAAIIPLLKRKLFINSFMKKGRLSYLLKLTPVFVVNDKKAALKGAAHYILKIQSTD